MLILLDVYQNAIKGEKRPVPPIEVRQATNEYLNSINTIMNFIDETFEVTIVTLSGTVK